MRSGRSWFVTTFFSGVLALAAWAPGALVAGCTGGGGGGATTGTGRSCIGGCSYSTGCGSYCSFSTFQCSRTFCCAPGRTCGDGTNGPCGSCL